VADQCRAEDASQQTRAALANMADHCEPTQKGFVNRRKKGQMVKALTEANLPDVAMSVQKPSAALP
jgi:hypothetical protein